MTLGCSDTYKYCKVVNCFVLCMTTVFLVAQNPQKFSKADDSIKNILENAISEIDAYRDIDEAKRKTFQVEPYVDLSDNLYLKGLLNSSKMLIHYDAYDFVKTKEHADKAIVYFEQVNSKEKLAFVYEVLGVYWSFFDEKEKEMTAMLKAEKYYEGTTDESKKIDIFYNLSTSFLERENWKKSIFYAEKSLSAIKKTNVKKNRKSFLYHYLGNSYLMLNNLKKAKQCFDKSLSLAVSNKSIADSHLGLAKYYKRIGNIDKSYKHYNLSSELYLKFANSEAIYIDKRKILKSEIESEELKNKKILAEKQLNKQQLKFNNYLMLFSVAIIIVLVVLMVLQKRNSRFKARSNLLLIRKNNELLRAKNLAEKASILKSDFVEKVTHELRTPLNTITTISYLLKKEKQNGVAIDYIETIDISSKHLLGFINDMIDINLLKKKSEIVLDNEIFGLKEMLTGVVGAIDVESSKNKLEFVFDDNIPKHVCGDELKLAQIFINLLTNANTYAKNGKVKLLAKLELKTEDKATVVFSVEDDGIGMGKEVQQALFSNVGYAAMLEKRKHKKIGLGLSVVKELLDLHGSSLFVSSDIGNGTKLTFSIGFNIKEELKSNNKDIDKVTNEIKLLLVEDNKVNQLLTQRVLETNGFYCDVANNGLEAVNMCKEYEYSAILMDIMMPVMDGYEATKKIRGFNKDVPILGLTALSEEMNKKSFEEVGITVVLSKPVDPDLLFKAIFKEFAPS